MQGMYMRALTEEEVEMLKCHWQEDKIGLSWETECGYTYQADGGNLPLPDDDDFKYCPFCGSEISLDN